MASFRTFSSVAVLVALSAASLPAFAQDNVTKAAVASREAETLLAAGKTAEACGKLEESQALDPRGGTVLDLALCREKEGRIGTAYRLFEEAEKTALAEKRNDRVTTARVRKNALFAKVPRLTITVSKEAQGVAGLEVRAGLASDPKAQVVVPPSEFGKPYAIDPGDLRISAGAAGHKTWEEKVELKQGTKKAVTVPALVKGEDAGGAAAAAAPVKPADPAKPAAKPADAKPTEEPAEEPEEAPEAPSAGSGRHEGGRFVFDIQVLAGGHLSALSQTPLAEIDGTQYIYEGTNGSQFLASCGDIEAVEGAGTCNAKFDPALALMLGGQIFAGYALTDNFHLGARGIGAVHIPSGFSILGGPSMSIGITDKLWIGGTFLLGTTETETVVIGGEGSVPEELRAENEGNELVDIPVADLAGGFSNGNKAAAASGGFELGGSLEVSYALIDLPSSEWTSGAFMLSAWPTIMAAPGRGLIVALPIGFGYRFY